MRWRTVMAVLVFALTINGVGSYAIFAKAAEVQAVASDQLDGLIWQVRKDECQAPPGTPLREVLSRRRKDLTDKYRAITGERYDLPDCSSFRS